MFREWEAYCEVALEYKKGESWDRLLHQGIHLLERFAQDDRIRIRDPRKNLQLQKLRLLSDGGEFIAYLDAVGELDGTRSSAIRGLVGLMK